MFTSCVNISQMLMAGTENCHNTLVYSALDRIITAGRVNLKTNKTTAQIAPISLITHQLCSCSMEYTITVEKDDDVTTGLDNTPSPMTNGQKIIYNGQLLIIRDGKTYNAMGQEVK